MCQSSGACRLLLHRAHLSWKMRQNSAIFVPPWQGILGFDQGEELTRGFLGIGCAVPACQEETSASKGEGRRDVGDE